jgi:uncharacterized protein (TIGR02271 family)
VLRRIKNKGKPDKLVIEFDDGTRLMTAEAQLALRNDGTALLLRSSTAPLSIPPQAVELASGEELVIPVAAEQIHVQKRRVVRGIVRIQTRVETTEKTVDETLIHEEVIVERTPIDKVIGDEHPRIREEDGVLVIPVVEEVLVVSKQLLLKEELRVIRRKKSVHKPQTFQVRRQTVEVERVKQEAVPDEQGQNQVPLPTKKAATARRKSAKSSNKPRSDTPKKAVPKATKSQSAGQEPARKNRNPSRVPEKKGK